MRRAIVPVVLSSVVVFLSTWFVFSVLAGCQRSQGPSGPGDPWQAYDRSLGLVARLVAPWGRIVKDRSPRPDWEQMLAAPEELAFLWADYAGPRLYGLLAMSGTGEAVYIYASPGGPHFYSMVQATVPKDSLDGLWRTIGTSGFLGLEREYYAKGIVDGMALTIGVRGKGGQKVVYAYNYFPRPVRQVTTAVIQRILGTAPPVDLETVLEPDDSRWSRVSPAPDAANVQQLYGHLSFASSRGQTPREFLERQPGWATVPRTWMNLLWVETEDAQPQWVLEAFGGRGGAAVCLTYKDGDAAGVPEMVKAAGKPWKQVELTWDEKTVLEVASTFLSTRVHDGQRDDRRPGTDGRQVFTVFRGADEGQKLRFMEFYSDAAKPEVSAISALLHEKAVPPSGEGATQVRSLSPLEAWTFLKLLGFAYP